MERERERMLKLTFDKRRDLEKEREKKTRKEVADGKRLEESKEREEETLETRC